MVIRSWNLSDVDGGVMETGAELIESLGFDSSTHYQFVHFTNIDKDYTEIIEDVKKEWTEDSYLEPDDLYGYGYLEAVKEVFKKQAESLYKERIRLS